MSGFYLIDDSLRHAAEKVAAGERLSREDGIALYASNDLTGIGQMADHVRRRMNGDRVHFMVNRHINPTNICENRCKFCAFSRSKGQEGAYEMTLAEIVKAAEEAVPDGAHEVH
ncbi:MAG: radical SAM protein, partial [Actinobacteria bacterium]